MKILVCGLEDPQNQFSRFVESCGMESVHMPGLSSSKSIPVLDGAIIITGNASHQMFWDVKEVYKDAGVPYFVSNNSTASIKEDFMFRYFGKEREAFKNLHNTEGVLYMFARHFRDEVVKNKILEDLYAFAYKQIPQQSWYTTIASLKEHGYISSPSHGKLKFEGLDQKMTARLIKAGLDVTVKEKPKPEAKSVSDSLLVNLPEPPPPPAQEKNHVMEELILDELTKVPKLSEIEQMFMKHMQFSTLEARINKLPSSRRTKMLKMIEVMLEGEE